MRNKMFTLILLFVSISTITECGKINKRSWTQNQVTRDAICLPSTIEIPHVPCEVAGGKCEDGKCILPTIQARRNCEPHECHAKVVGCRCVTNMRARAPNPNEEIIDRKFPTSHHEDKKFPRPQHEEKKFLHDEVRKIDKRGWMQNIVQGAVDVLCTPTNLFGIHHIPCEVSGGKCKDGKCNMPADFKPNVVKPIELETGETENEAISRYDRHIKDWD